MIELFDALIHPSKWSQLGELSARQRSLAALLVLGLFALFAVLVGSLTGRWAQARSKESGAGGDRKSILSFDGVCVLSSHVSPREHVARQLISDQQTPA